MNTSDAALIERVQKGDKFAFAQILDIYSDRIERYVRRMVGHNDVATDIVQDVFIKAYININSFDLDRKFGPWIYRIAHNECVNYFKKKKSLNLTFFQFDTILPSNNELPEQVSDFINKENKSRIEKILNEIDIKYREVIVLNYFEDLDYKEISEALGIPVSTVGVRIMRAKKLLEKLLQNKI